MAPFKFNGGLIMTLIYIGLGGFLGAISRYLVSKYINSLFLLAICHMELYL